jgi:hypothetical protein
MAKKRSFVAAGRAKRIFDLRSDRLCDADAGVYGAVVVTLAELDHLVRGSPAVSGPGADSGTLADLLTRVRAGVHPRPANLLAIRCDHEVRQALQEGLRRATPARISGYVFAIGHAGGPGALTALRAQARAVAAEMRSGDSTSGRPPHARLPRILQAILRLTDDVSAARTMQTLFARGDPEERARIAVHVGALTLDGPRFSPAMVVLREILERVLHDEDKVFIGAVRALAPWHPDTVRLRVANMLRTTASAELRRSIIERAAACSMRVSSALVRHYPCEPTLELRLAILGLGRECVSSSASARDLQAALELESPYLRLQALLVIRRMPSSATRAKLESVATEDPDPYLRGVIGAELPQRPGRRQARRQR